MKNMKPASFGVIGLGRFGTALAKSLAESGKEVIVIDCNEDKVRELRHFTEYAYVAENLTKETLEEVGIQNCDAVIVCIGEKIDTSILTTLNVVSLNVPHVIAKAISRDQGAVLEKIGAEVVYPERDMALRLGKRLVSHNFLDYISLDNEVEIQQIPVTAAMIGRSVQEMNIRQKYGLNIIAIERECVTNIEVSPQFRFSAGDIIVVIGKVENIKRFEETTT
ncbi:potassium channel family protein [Novisyntrophococcus fermenticellae]|uniref:potassium channel family protein n=1 Tax=Novisyntrophococcus fermenticellae TaxID=2068655 RepID=UPI001E2B3918|nr:TrkA family potassium uptake protein [Novisyntrophococcus fermenticellae]